MYPKSYNVHVQVQPRSPPPLSLSCTHEMVFARPFPTGNEYDKKLQRFRLWYNRRCVRFEVIKAQGIASIVLAQDQSIHQCPFEGRMSTDDLVTVNLVQCVAFAGAFG